MIADRPSLLSENPLYVNIPEGPVAVDLQALPDLLRHDLSSLSGVQPVTKASATAAKGELRDNISPGEAALYKERGSRFQLIFIVLNLYALKPGADGGHVGRPYSISLMPASKRGLVENFDIGWVENFDLELFPFAGHAYLDFDPFTGDRGLFGQADMFQANGFLSKLHPDELGYVTGGFILAPLSNGDLPLYPDAGLKGAEANARYLKFRSKTFFRPFAVPNPRRVWGLDSPIELFLAQALAEKGLYPEFQTLFLKDGSVFPSYYHMLDDPLLRTRLDAITLVDLYFPEQRLAIFCDGRSFHRGGRGREKDDAISRKLQEVGISVLRIPGRRINLELASAVGEVLEALDRAS